MHDASLPSWVTEFKPELGLIFRKNDSRQCLRVLGWLNPLRVVLEDASAGYGHGKPFEATIPDLARAGYYPEPSRKG